MTRDILVGVLSLCVLLSIPFIILNTKFLTIRSLTNETPFIPEVKLSKQEAESWNYLTSFTISTIGNGKSTTSITWAMPYSTKLRISYKIDIIPPKYYTCNYYECRQCRLYSYQYCTLYSCTVKEGTPYAICQRTVDYEWKCPYTYTKENVGSGYFEGEAKDGPDWDWWTVEYLNLVPFSPIPYNGSAKGEVKIVRLLIFNGLLLNTTVLYNELIKYDTPLIAKIFFTDGTSFEYYIKSYYITLDKDTKTIEISMVPAIPYLKGKYIKKIELWENEGFDWDKFFAVGDKIGIIYDVRAYETITDYRTFTNYDSVKKYEEENNVKCTVTKSEIQTKTFYNVVDCSNVNWTCPLGAHCYNLITKETGTISNTTTYSSSSKTELYLKGCSDENIVCVQTSTKTGTYYDYIKDISNKDASNPTCIQWDVNVDYYSQDRTHVTGNPPFVSCEAKTSISRNPIPYGTCIGPVEDEVTKPLVVQFGDIRKEYYSSIEDTVELDVSPNTMIPITLQGPTFGHFSYLGITSLSAVVEVLSQNPYLVSDTVKDISPPDKSYKALEYIATIKSPGNTYARFLPPICPNLNEYKYIYAFINDNPISENPCYGRGAVIYLKEGTNTFKIDAFSIDPSRFKSCIEKYNTCEEQDLYGCPQQCKVNILDVVLPKSLIVYTGIADTKKIPIKIKVDKDGYILVRVEGTGVIPENKIYKVTAGENTIYYNASYYIYTTKPTRTKWKVIISSPPIIGATKIEQLTKTYEINVDVIQKSWSPMLEHPEIIIIVMIILIVSILVIRSLTS